MNELKNNKFLLVILLLLVITKFVFLPFIEWQNDLNEQNVALEKKHGKIEQLVKNKDYFLLQNESLTKELSLLEPLFFESKTEAEFKLEQQKKVEQLFDKNSLFLTNVAWQTSSKVDELGLIEYRLHLTFDGDFHKIQNVFITLENSTPWVKINEFHISFVGDVENQLGFVKGGRLLLSMYANINSKENANAVE